MFVAAHLPKGFSVHLLKGFSIFCHFPFTEPTHSTFRPRKITIEISVNEHLFAITQVNVADL